MGEPVDHLFRREAGRITATLVRIFGVRNLALAEDVVQEAFCRALEVWPFKGMPQEPDAWLMTTAKNCARDALRRARTVRRATPELSDELQSEWTLAPTIEEQFAPDEIRDDLLRMMFSCCHPRLPETAQVVLILNVLCGFSVEEVAAAFMNSQAATEKRIARAKKTLAESRTLFNVSVARDFAARLEAVQRALYLLFNEGYHGASSEVAVNAQLCAEARHLVSLVVALNRAIAIAQAHGPECGLEAVGAIRERDRLDSYPFYAATLGEFELKCGRYVRARQYFEDALALTRNPAERRFFLWRQSTVGKVRAVQFWLDSMLFQVTVGFPPRGMASTRNGRAVGIEK